MTDWKTIEREWTNRIFDSVQAIREASGLTIDELRQRLNSAGWDVSTNTLSGMLSARKRSSVSVAEVAMFAAALRVAPLFLILGLPEARRATPAPAWGDDFPVEALYAWFIGRSLDHDADYFNLAEQQEWIPALASGTMANLGAWTREWRSVQWAAARFVAAALDSDDDFEAGAPSGDQLSRSLERLRDVHARVAKHRGRSDGPRTGVTLRELPAVASKPVSDMSLDDVRSLTTEVLVRQAKAELLQRGA